MGDVEDRVVAVTVRSSMRRYANAARWGVLAAAAVWALVAGVSDVVQLARVDSAAIQQPTRIAVGAPAPGFQLTTLQGGELVTLGTFQGRPLVLSFFASWCDSCREEFPLINAMAGTAPVEGYALLGVAVDDEREAVQRLVRDEGLSLPVALDTVGRVARAYAVTGPPLTYFIDGHGTIREIVAGPLTPERSERGLRAAFTAAPAATASVRVGSSGSTLSAAGPVLAVGAGMLSFLSPCVMPLLPGYLAFITGVAGTPGTTTSAPDRGRRRRVISRTVAFALGLILVFTALGTSASLAGAWLTAYRPLLTRVGGVMVLSFGLHMTGLLPLPLLYREFRPGLQSRTLDGRGMLHAALLGGAFALGWTPCVGPVLGSILLLASQTDAAAQGA
ncbi:MAG: hypothetical protein C4558_08415, partial [Dehalococcoidia bacterium]